MTRANEHKRDDGGKKESNHGLIHNFFFIITTAITILTFFREVVPNIVTEDVIRYSFVVSIALFFVLVSALLCIFLFRLEPDIKDGRYWLIFIPAILSIISIFFYFKKNNPENNWGLYTLIAGFLLFLLIIVLVFAAWIKRAFVESDSKEYTVNTVSTTLTRLGDNRFEYDIYKTIQSGKPLLTQMEIRFKWSGDKIDSSKVIASSVTHKAHPIEVEDEDQDHVKLSFDTPLIFRQMTTCHLHLGNLTDKETPSQPYLAFNVKEDEPVKLVRFNVLLKDVDRHYDRPAVFERKRKNSPNGVQYTPIGEIEFDQVTKSYKYDLVNPEPGYDYRVNWKERKV